MHLNSHKSLGQSWLEDRAGSDSDLREKHKQPDVVLIVGFSSLSRSAKHF